MFKMWKIWISTLVILFANKTISSVYINKKIHSHITNVLHKNKSTLSINSNRNGTTLSVNKKIIINIAEQITRTKQIIIS